MTHRIVIGTGNAKKLVEMRELLAGLDVEIESAFELRPELESPEETGVTFEDNARLKAEYFARHCSALCVADDSGLEVDALDGRPGVHSARYAGEDCDDAANNAKLLEELEGVAEDERGAQFRSVIAIASPGATHLVTEGIVRGRILEEARGEGGFGYDPLFFHEPSDATFAEIARADKLAVSHRGIALRKLKELLPGLLSVIDNRKNF